jgi:thioredoxin 1
MAVINLNDEAFKAELDSNKKILVKYYAAWCGNCKLIAPKFRRLSDDERFSDISFIEIDAEHNPEARKLAAVDSLPFFASFEAGKLNAGKATSIIQMVEDMAAELKNA